MFRLYARSVFFAISLGMFFSTGFSAESEFMKMGSTETGGIVDLALIYQGGTHRIDWTAEQFGPYLTWTDPETKKEQWLFDGFLFLEFKSNTGFMFAKGYGHKPADKEEQLWYLERIFEKGKSVHALDEALGEKIAQIGTPPRPRRVVLTLPEPITTTENWGELDGKKLDFKNTEDRIAAVRWFMDLLIERWEKEGFKNLELAGFYWVAEEMGDSDQELMQAVSKNIHERGKKFYWIPWWNSPGSKVWKSLGFDAAYQQPNLFFHLEVPKERVKIACDFAKSQGMGMEMEWDERLMNQPNEYVPQALAYLDGFEKAGVFESGAVAHYMAGHGMINLSKSTKPEVKAIYERLCRILSKRQLEKTVE